MANRDYTLLPANTTEIELEPISNDGAAVRNRRRRQRSTSPTPVQINVTLSTREEFINARNKRISKLNNLKGQYLQVSNFDHASEDFSEEFVRTCIEALVVSLVVAIMAAFMELGFLLTIIVIGTVLLLLMLIVYLLANGHYMYYVLEVIDIFLMVIYIGTTIYRLVFAFTLSQVMPWIVTIFIAILAIFSVVIMISISNIANAAKNAKLVRLQRIAVAQKHEQQ